jgi:hypothetical protein
VLGPLPRQGLHETVRHLSVPPAAPSRPSRSWAWLVAALAGGAALLAWALLR